MNILFLYLKAFSDVGGIERFNKVFLKSLSELNDNTKVRAFSLYDKSADRRYFNPIHFKGFSGNKFTFFIKSIFSGLFSSTVILGHLNLACIGLIIKIIKPSTKVILITYGIDVWLRPSKCKKQMLAKASYILTISNFTKDNLAKIHNVNEDKIKVLFCALDPYLDKQNLFKKPRNLLEKYNISQDTKIITTVSRLSFREQYKGYDKVIEALVEVNKVFPDIRYILVGKAIGPEIKRINKIIKRLHLENYVIITDFVPDNELIDYYNLSDVFVMPSKMEGFGIVFLEALACGKPVIAGNQDASGEALLEGELGILVNPDNVKEISDAIIKIFKKEVPERLLDGGYLRQRIIEKYSFDRFKQRVKMFIEGL